ncbi:mitochondrial FAD carrier protein [Gigaspora margarita]|uniref:Mitochondrial FAD carrier protein n=1 Tax=Gigaspora margarita TaxID=4874 RepID=A0A8H3XDJ6_GIGMA|nr:mitochondrial FAD carrier protein [Gigaspora margarita]
MPKSFLGNPALDHAAAGFTAGAVSTIILHPLDLIKTRFQADDSIKSLSKRHFGATFNTLRSIVQKEGIIGLYRGISPNLAGSTASWGFYFYWYDLIKRWMANGDKLTKLSATQHLLASAEAGAITVFMTNPFWVVKTRMCVTSRKDPEAYKGLIGNCIHPFRTLKKYQLIITHFSVDIFFQIPNTVSYRKEDGLYQIAKYEGIRGLYKGLVPGLLGVSNGALQFMFYEEMKKWRLRISPEEDRERLDNIEYILVAGSSKTIANVATYPYQLIRTRLNNQKFVIKYNGVIDAIRKVYSSEGFLGFYKGLAPNTLRVLPGTCTTFLVYENMSAFFRKHARFDE